MRSESHPGREHGLPREFLFIIVVIVIEGKKGRRKEREPAGCYVLPLSSAPSLAVCFVKERVNGIGGPAAAANDDVPVPYVRWGWEPTNTSISALSNGIVGSQNTYARYPP